MARIAWPPFVELDGKRSSAKEATLTEFRIYRAAVAVTLDMLDQIIKRAQSDDSINEDEPLYQQLFPLADKLKAVERREQRRLSNRGF